MWTIIGVCMGVYVAGIFASEAVIQIIERCKK